MTESQYENQKKEITPAPQIEPIPIPPAPTLAPDLATYLAVLEVLQRPKRYLSSAPTSTPKNFAEQIQFYENGSTRRIYCYVNGTWRYAALT